MTGGFAPPFYRKKIMATFRCLQSGNTVTFTLQHDIDSMRGHGGYVRVDDVQETLKSEESLLASPEKRMGRPRRPAPVEVTI
jgi:hypothetical protein